jgi:DNA-binding transcriptional regulator LsrR (DeoR family)
MTNEEKVWLALKWLEPMIQAGDASMKFKDLQQKFRQKFGRTVTERTASEAIRKAFRNGLVTVQKHKVMPQYAFDDAKADELKSVFRLKRVIVAAVDGPAGSDHVHEQLGHAVATKIDKSFGWFNEDEKIALGSGRAVFSTIATLKAFRTADEISPIYLFSLTGSVFPRTTQMAARELLDGDTHVTLFAEYFGKEAHINTIRYPIAAPTPRDRDDWLRNTWLAQFDAANLTHAIVGVGILRPSHRMHDWLLEETKREEAVKEAGRKGAGRKRTPPPSTLLKPVEAKLRKLIEEVEEITASYPGYNPVADVCNRFFVVSPPPSIPEREGAKIFRSLDAKVKVINDHLLTVTKTQLTKAKNVMLVAGTKDKARAIYHLLTLRLKGGVPFKVDTLCVDYEAACEILNCFHERAVDASRRRREAPRQVAV